MLKVTHHKITIDKKHKLVKSLYQLIVVRLLLELKICQENRYLLLKVHALNVVSCALNAHADLVQKLNLKSPTWKNQLENFSEKQKAAVDK